jgi:predicted short-subunit dehydrogenase-like oxidoreductase (DUF2520 family)
MNPTGGATPASSLASAIEPAGVVVLAVPDGTLAALAHDLAGLDVVGKLVVHCCGAMPASVLDPVAAVGAETATFHPIQSFAPLVPDEVAEFTPPRSHFMGIAVGIEATDTSYPRLKALAQRLGCTPLRLSGDQTQRALYHAAAVVAGNAMVGLLDFALDLMEMAGVDRSDGRFALLPLMGGTLANLVTHAPGDALTGPVVRGDGETIARHLDALAGDPALQALYSNLSARLLLLAVKSGRLTEDQAMSVSNVLLSRLMRPGNAPDAGKSISGD